MIKKIGFLLAASFLLFQSDCVRAQVTDNATNPENEEMDYDVVFPGEDSDQDFDMGGNFDPMLSQSMGEAPGPD